MALLSFIYLFAIEDVNYKHLSQMKPRKLAFLNVLRQKTKKAPWSHFEYVSQENWKANVKHLVATFVTLKTYIQNKDNRSTTVIKDKNNKMKYVAYLRVWNPSPTEPS